MTDIISDARLAEIRAHLKSGRSLCYHADYANIDEDDITAIIARLDKAEAGCPAAWMRRWAYDGVDVMAIKKPDRPRGWACHATTTDKLFDNDVPLYAHPLPPPPES